MDEPPKHYAKQKKPYMKDYTLYDFIYIKLLESRSVVTWRLRVGTWIDCK